MEDINLQIRNEHIDSMGHLPQFEECTSQWNIGKRAYASNKERDENIDKKKK